MFTFNPIGFVSSPFKETASIPKGLGAKHSAEGVLNILPEFEPGLTGIAQVYAARDISRRNKFRFDLLYPKRQGLWLDVRLILTSGWNSLSGRWEKIGCNKVQGNIKGSA